MDEFKFETEKRVTKLFTVQGLDLIIEQIEKSTKKKAFVHHYSNPGYYSFGALVFARWYYGLDEKELDIYHMEGFEVDICDFPMMLLSYLEVYIEKLEKKPETREIFSVPLFGSEVIAKLTLEEKGLQYEKEEDILLIEREIIDDCLNAIIKFGRVYGMANEKFLKIYEHFKKVSKGHKSPYKPQKNLLDY